MEPLSERELDGLLRTWEAPEPPAGMRASLFGKPAATGWRAFFGASVRIPLPVAALAAVALVLVLWMWPRPVVYRDSPPRVEVQTVKVEVPVVKKEVVTRVVYRERTSDAGELRPVTELKPRIMRSRNADE
jgi:hypothetical protein